MNHLLLVLICSSMFQFLLPATAGAQTAVPFGSPRWTVKGEVAVQETHLGRPALKLKNASALLADANFRNGIIEFDIALTKTRYFPALDFRMVDSSNFEEYYLRPHQSGNPDAMQYLPVTNRQGGWQLYYGVGYNNAVELPFGRWLHVKLVVKEKEAEVFFDNGADPVLYISPLMRGPVSGMISLSNPWPVEAWYSNFLYQPSDAVTIKSKPRVIPPLPANTVTGWELSSQFPEKTVTEKHWLHKDDTASLTWRWVGIDHNGIADFAPFTKLTKELNTVFVKKVIEMDAPGTKKFVFGFSDRARVYLNGRLLYGGADGFMSSDYRFLGTVGYWDALYLDLKKGRNELWVAISEDFGGWGIKARLE